MLMASCAKSGFQSSQSSIIRGGDGEPIPDTWSFSVDAQAPRIDFLDFGGSQSLKKLTSKTRARTLKQAQTLPQGSLGTKVTASFDMSGAKKVDIIMVLDTSLTQKGTLGAIATKMQSIISKFDAGTSWQIKIVPNSNRNDSTRADRGRVLYPKVGLSNAAVEFIACGPNARYFLFKGTGPSATANQQAISDLARVLQAIGTAAAAPDDDDDGIKNSGDYLEATVFGASLALTCNVTEVNPTTGVDDWLRPDSNIAIIFVTDQENCSGGTTNKEAQKRCEKIDVSPRLIQASGNLPSGAFTRTNKDAKIFKDLITMPLPLKPPNALSITSSARILSSAVNDHQRHVWVYGIFENVGRNNIHFADSLLSDSGNTPFDQGSTPSQYDQFFQDMSTKIKPYWQSSVAIGDFSIVRIDRFDNQTSSDYSQIVHSQRPKISGSNPFLGNPDSGTMQITAGGVNIPFANGTFNTSSITNDMVINIEYVTGKSSFIDHLDLEFPADPNSINVTVRNAVGAASGSAWVYNKDFDYKVVGGHYRLTFLTRLPKLFEAHASYKLPLAIDPNYHFALPETVTSIEDVKVDGKSLAHNAYSWSQAAGIQLLSEVPVGKDIEILYTTPAETGNQASVATYHLPGSFAKIEVELEGTCSDIVKTIDLKTSTVSLRCPSDPGIQGVVKFYYAASDDVIALPEYLIGLAPAYDIECSVSGKRLVHDTDWQIDQKSITVRKKVITTLVEDTPVSCIGKRKGAPK